jgi:hypothetical protein
MGLALNILSYSSANAATPNCNGLRATIISSASQIQGTNGRDVIVVLGNRGSKVVAQAGNDVICGSSGSDVLDGGAGNDTIFAQSGNDRVIGGAGNDLLNGGAGNDALQGGTGTDKLNTGSGTNYCAVDNADPIVGQCTLDGQGPMVSNTSVVAAGTVVTFSWKISDISGIDSSWVKIGGPSGWVVSWCGFVIMGEVVSVVDGVSTYSVKCQIPSTAVNAVYTAFIDGVDFFGKPAQQTQINFMITSGVSDAMAPVTSNVTVVDGDPVTRQPITITWNSTDISGVENVMVWVMLKDGGFANNSGRSYFDYGTPTRISGTALDGEYQQVITPNAQTISGTYGIWISARDIYGNKVFAPSNVNFQTP